MISTRSTRASTKPSPDPEETLIALEDGERLRQAIAALPAPLRETLVMRDVNGLSYRDIAEATGAPIGTVMSRLARARGALCKDPESRAMTDDPDDRIFRLNAALDGELDPIRALELERDLSADPALAAEYRRLEALRQAIGRSCPARGRAEGAHRARRRVDGAGCASFACDLCTGRRPAWSGARALALAASFAVLGFAVGSA